MAKSKSTPLSIPVLIGLKGKGLDEAVRDVKKVSKGLTGLADTAAKAALGFAAFKGADMAFDFLKDSVKGARDLQVNLNGLQSVFGEFTPQMIEFGKEAKTFGLSISEAAKASTFIGSVLKQSGFAIEETTYLTQDLIKAAADLSLTYGYDVQEALLAITALFRGEYDPIEKFGVAMKQSEIDAEKFSRGLGDLTGAAERFVDQQIRVQFFFDRASDSLGAYERQQGTLRVAQDQLSATWKNTTDILGTALLPALADATAALIPLAEAVGPILAAAIKQVIPMFTAFVNNEENIVELAKQIITTMAALYGIFAKIGEIVISLTGFLKEWGGEILFVAGALYGLRVGVASIAAVSTALQAFGIQIKLVKWQLRALKVAMLAIPVIGWVTALTLVGDAAMEVAGAVDAAGGEMENFLDAESLLAEVDAFKLESDAAMADMGNTMSEAVDSAGGQVKNAVADFYGKLGDEINKQQAKLSLESMGASKGLIDMILGSGEDWQRVFAEVTARGRAGIAEVQAMFRQTAAGFDEAMQEWEEKYGEPFRQFKQDAESARDSFVDFLDTLAISPSIAEDLGRFEQEAVDALTSIEEKLQDAFDNEYILEDSYRNLVDYARQEYGVLRQIERQRDEIIARRDAAMRMIQSVNDSILSGARLVGVLQDIQGETSKVDVASVVKKTIADAKNLREFEVIVTSAVIEPIQEVTSQSQQLVSGYRDIVERTRAFVTDMKALRALGLDPELFNQLVEAGVDAGGATAKALIEGGTDTVNEVNNLFSELNALGAELGEETAQVMYGQGENFVNGIVEGLGAQAEALEEQGKALAEAFTTTFEDILIAGIEAAIAAAEAALAKMPKFDGQPGISRPSGGGGDGGSTGTTPSITTPLLPDYKPSLGTQILASGTPTVKPSMTSPYRPPSYSYTPTTSSNVNLTVNMVTSSARVANSTLSNIYSRYGNPTSVSGYALTAR